MTGLGVFATGVFVAACLVVAAGLVVVRRLRRRSYQPRRADRAPSWDRATHRYTVLRDQP